MERSTGTRRGHWLLGVLLVVALAGTALVPGQAAASNRFVDVPDIHPFHDDIDWLASSGITTGYSDNTFRPALPVTRQAMAAFLWRMAGSPVAPPSTFTDIPADHPFANAIGWLAAEGITTGYSDNTFRPGLPVTRQAMAAYLYRLADEPAAPPPTFLDIGPGHPFGDAIGWLVDAGITNGYADGTFGPGLAITRQAMAAFLHRYDQWSTQPPTPQITAGAALGARFSNPLSGQITEAWWIEISGTTAPGGFLQVFLDGSCSTPSGGFASSVTFYVLSDPGTTPPSMWFTDLTGVGDTVPVGRYLGPFDPSETLTYSFRLITGFTEDDQMSECSDPLVITAPPGDPIP